MLVAILLTTPLTNPPLAPPAVDATTPAPLRGAWASAGMAGWAF